MKEIRKQKEIPKIESQNPSIQVLDCTDVEKLVLLRESGYVFLAIQDSKGECKGLIALRLKSPYAKNFAKLVQALQPINDCIVEQFETDGGKLA